MKEEMKAELAFLHKVAANQDQMIAQLIYQVARTTTEVHVEKFDNSGLLENEKELMLCLRIWLMISFKTFYTWITILLMKLHTG